MTIFYGEKNCYPITFLLLSADLICTGSYFPKLNKFFLWKVVIGSTAYLQ